MIGETTLLMLIAGIVWLWLDSARAREMATTLASEYCRRSGLQFLDGTAALARTRLRWTNNGLRLRRLFRFDYSEAGMGRHTGHLILIGTSLEEFSLGLPGNGSASPQNEGNGSPPANLR